MVQGTRVWTFLKPVGVYGHGNQLPSLAGNPKPGPRWYQEVDRLVAKQRGCVRLWWFGHALALFGVGFKAQGDHRHGKAKRDIGPTGKSLG